MFLLFINLYNSLFLGYWEPYNNLTTAFNSVKGGFNSLGEFVTSIFGDFQYKNLGSDFIDGVIPVISFILALFTSIGIVVMAVKGVKKAFGIFFMGIRR